MSDVAGCAVWFAGRRGILYLLVSDSPFEVRPEAPACRHICCVGVVEVTARLSRARARAPRQVCADPRWQRRRPQGRQPRRGQGARAVPDLRHGARLGVQPGALHVPGAAGDGGGGGGRDGAGHSWQRGSRALGGALGASSGALNACARPIHHQLYPFLAPPMPPRASSRWTAPRCSTPRARARASSRRSPKRSCGGGATSGARHPPLLSPPSRPRALLGRGGRRGLTTARPRAPADCPPSSSHTRARRIPFPIAAFSPTGYIDTLYLDPDLRVRRAPWGLPAPRPAPRG